MPSKQAIDAQTGPSYDYATYPRRFVSYRWFKPLLVLGLGFVFMLGLQMVLIAIAWGWAGDFGFILSIGTGYDDMDAFTGPGALAELGGVAVILGALALAALIVRDRPWSSYSSSRGGWNWGAFGKCLIVAAVLFAIETGIEFAFFSDGTTAPVRFTVVGFVACTVLVPFQCVAEEYLFRGFVLQTVGAWSRLPVLGIIVSAVIFAAGHPYNALGVASIFVNGIVWGFIAWKTRGLEATSALHIVNNLAAFYFAGFGLSGLTSEVDAASFAIAAVIDVVFALAVLFADRRFGWFGAKGDGTVRFNAKKREKMAFKQRLKAGGGQPAAGTWQPAQPVQPFPGLVAGETAPVLSPRDAMALADAVMAAGTTPAWIMDLSGAAVAGRVRGILGEVAAGDYPGWVDKSDRYARNVRIDPRATVPLATVLCGSGNNGTVGWATAVHLARSGHPVAVLSAAHPLSIDDEPMRTALTAALEELVRLGAPVLGPGEEVPLDENGGLARWPIVVFGPDGDQFRALIHRARVVVDAVLGTGEKSSLALPYSDWVATTNLGLATHAILAVDLPSGVSANNGSSFAPRVLADETIALMVRKPAHTIAHECGLVCAAPLVNLGPFLQQVRQAGTGAKTGA